MKTDEMLQVVDLHAALTAKIERLQVRNAALVESLRAHKCQVDYRSTVGECQQCGCTDGLLIRDVDGQLRRGGK